MKQLEFVELTHAKTGRKIYFLPVGSTWFFEFDEKAGETHLFSVDGRMVPVKEDTATVCSQFKRALGGANE